MDLVDAMTVFLQDADCTLYHGDVLDVLQSMESESVDCVVTSPPYWGLRDYGTGEWEGGDEGCDHVSQRKEHTLESSSRLGYPSDGGQRRIGADNTYHEAYTTQYRDVCGRCGARRVDRQIGLEPTPDAFVESLVAVFREVRRVLAPHGTCWVNLGDSYAAQGGSTQPTPTNTGNVAAAGPHRVNNKPLPGLKPKDLCGVPWRVAFALQADGWWLRSDIIWAKPNPMPESVTDRPTKAHEYVFLLTKQPRYFFDAEAVREPYRYDGRKVTTVEGRDGSIQHRKGERWPGIGKASHAARASLISHGHDENEPMEINHAGRNIRSVWTVATQPYPEAHFATYPEELVRRCVLAGCPVRVCRVCGKPSERLVDVEQVRLSGSTGRANVPGLNEQSQNYANMPHRTRRDVTTVGWSDCGHNDYRPGRVLDPFVGSGTSCKVARDHGRHSVGIDLNADYLELAAKRLSQQSLFSEAAS